MDEVKASGANVPDREALYPKYVRNLRPDLKRLVTSQSFPIDGAAHPARKANTWKEVADCIDRELADLADAELAPVPGGVGLSAFSPDGLFAIDAAAVPALGGIAPGVGGAAPAPSAAVSRLMFRSNWMLFRTVVFAPSVTETRASLITTWTTLALTSAGAESDAMADCLTVS